MPEAQAAMEAINEFNQDMQTIAANMHAMVSTLDEMNTINQDNLWNLESQTIDLIEEQTNVNDRSAEMIDMITVDGEILPAVPPSAGHTKHTRTDQSFDSYSPLDNSRSQLTNNVSSADYDEMVTSESQAAKNYKERISRLSLKM